MSLIGIVQSQLMGGGVAAVISGITPHYGEEAELYFGYDVAISSDGLVMAVGAINADDAAPNSGRVDVYDWNGTGWTPRNFLTQPSPSNDANFGSSVSLSSDGSVLAVGAQRGTGAWTQSGTAYVYDWDGTNWVKRPGDTGGIYIDSYDGGFYKWFGSGIALSGDGNFLAVGQRDSTYGSTLQTGRVLFYTWNGTSWSQGPVLTANDAGGFDLYGASVALTSDGNTLVVGASYWDDTFQNQGKVYIYDYTGGNWVLRNTLTSPNPSATGIFGFGSEISDNGDVLVVGEAGWDGTQTNQGAVHIYDRDGASWVLRTTIVGDDLPGEVSANPLFGVGIGLNGAGDYMLVGAAGVDGSVEVDVGKVYEYPTI